MSEERDRVVLAPEGMPIGGIRLPERCVNVVLGGETRNRLLMAASHRLHVVTHGVARR